MEHLDNGKKLPEAFLTRMKKQLGTEYDAFIASYDRKRAYGLRYNPLKIDRGSFLLTMPFTLREVPWAEEGFYYNVEEQPGKSILHEAGAFYIQEPSAMAVVPVLNPQPGERILDLCAAPGGKSTQIAGRLRGKGLLVSNEIIPNRARILSQNIERMGVANCVVCKEEPKRIAEMFSAFFDRVLVDAPCSGEGMFRKDDVAVTQWSPENVSMCAARQRDILEYAAGTVRPGGILVYSTCTFSVEENERVINEFIKFHPDFLIEYARIPGTDCISEQGKTARLWPHRIEGEGHFIARMRKVAAPGRLVYRTIEKETASGKMAKTKKNNKAKSDSAKTMKKLCEDFLHNELELTQSGIEILFKERMLYNYGDAVYLIPKEMIPLQGLRMERPGLQLGFCKKNRFEPSHALALFLHPAYVHRHYELTPEQAGQYLRGETFIVDMAMKGWYLLSIQGYSIGFGKAGNGQMKNHYPKGLRRNI